MDTNPIPGHVRRARFAVASTFLLHAAIFGSWAPRIPAIKERLHLGNDDLGLALGGLAIGLLVGTRLVGRFERSGRTAQVIRIVLWVQAVALLGPAYAWNLPSLTVCLFLLGILGGGLDVLMNVHAVAVERLYARPIMSGFHGLWSVGSMLAGGIAALMARADVDIRVHFLVVSIVCVVASIPLQRGLLRPEVESAANGHEALAAAHAEGEPGPGESGSSAAEAGRTDKKAPPAGLVVVGLLALMGFGAFLPEGAVGDWSAVFMHDNRGASAGLAALAFTVFSGAMAASRLVGDRVGERVGPVAMARGGAMLSALGYLGFLLVPNPIVALVGFALAGIGIGPVIPVVFSAGGNTRTARRPSVLGIVVSAGYAGSVIGPMAIGWVSAHIGLPWALGLPVVFLVLVAVAAGLLSNAAGGKRSGAIEPMEVVG